jgi:hypothetical protein
LAFSLVALLVVLIALVIANTRQVKLSWLVGSGHASLVWIMSRAPCLVGCWESSPASSSVSAHAAGASLPAAPKRPLIDPR